MRYAELPSCYKFELNVLETEALARINEGRLKDSIELSRRFRLLTSGIVAPEGLTGNPQTKNEDFNPWEYIEYDEDYLVTALPEHTSGITHSKIIFREFCDMEGKRFLPLHEEASIITKTGFMIDMFSATFCGDPTIDSEVLAFSRKLKRSLEVVPQILFVYQNREMLEIEL